MIGKLRAQRLVGPVVLRNHHQAGGVLVQPVHDAGPFDSADAGEAGSAMRDQGVDQRAGLMAGGGMHHQSPRLVDNDDVVVLIDDVERDIFARGFSRDRLRHVDCDRIPGGDMISGVADRGASDHHLALEDQHFQPRARELLKLPRKHPVEPARVLVAGDGELQPLAFRCVLFQRRARP